MENQNINPLVDVPPCKNHAAPLHQVRSEHFEPALKKAIERAHINIQAIKDDPSPPCFDNTILALEAADEQVRWIQGIYFNLLSAEATEPIQKLAAIVSPLLTHFVNDVVLDNLLFDRVRVVYNKQENLSGEQRQLLEEVYSNFVRNGALLNADQKTNLRKIDDELSLLSPLFSENVLKATNKFELIVDNPNDVEGIPESTLAQAADLAKTKGLSGQWIFTLQAPSFIPFVKYCKNRALREAISRAYRSRAFRDEFDNQDNIKKIISLKHKRAQLLGFKNHAAYVLEKRMAQSPEKVHSFLDYLLTYAKPAAQKEIKELQEFAQKTDQIDELQAWDINFYIEKIKKIKFNFDEELLRPYFKLENVIDGAFEHAQRLYGIEFKKSSEYPVYHPDVSTYEVFEKGTQKLVGIFYTDFHPRSTKQGGAWMTSFLGQGLFRGSVQRPHISIVCNFSPSTDNHPSLLTYDEVFTLFHEFGHALHGLLSQCTYSSISGTNVYWDFVELPSQLMENWTLEKEGLEHFAKHHITGEIIPQHLIDKLIKSQKFMAGYNYLSQIKLGTLDMSWHDLKNPQAISDVSSHEEAVTSDLNVIPPIQGANTSCSFSHIFDGGYSAGYYSYKWAEVLEADAFELFKENGIFNPETAKSFKDNILSRGGTEHPMDLYKKFRGREPDPKALLRRDGLI